MKKIIITLLVVLTSIGFSIGNFNPSTAIISSPDITVTVANADEESIFTKSIYNAVDEKIEFETTDLVDMIQIYNSEGELEFQLPIMSREVKISKALFSNGSNQLGFVVSGRSETYMTTVDVI